LVVVGIIYVVASVATICGLEVSCYSTTAASNDAKINKSINAGKMQWLERILGISQSTMETLQEKYRGWI